jgi:hypothetical protein
MATLKFDGSGHRLEILDKSGTSHGRWPAYNNIDHAFAKAHYGAMTHLHDGVYHVRDKLFPFSHKPDPDGPYGLHGIIRFDYPGHSGVGVHSGRAYAKYMPGPQHATHGCIRTTDTAMRAIRNIMGKDPLLTITIVHNSATSAKHGRCKHSGQL